MIPFYVSSKGYGYLWNLPSFGHVALNQRSTAWSSDSAYQVKSPPTMHAPHYMHCDCTRAPVINFSI
jgi:hypothetical protein